MNNNSETTQDTTPRMLNPDDWEEKLPTTQACFAIRGHFDNTKLDIGCGNTINEKHTHGYRHISRDGSWLCPDCFALHATPRNKENIQVLSAPQTLFRVPDSFDNFKDAGRFLIARELNEEKIVQLAATIDGHPYDVAYQLARAVQDQFGFTDLQSTYSFFEGERKPRFLSVQTDARESAEVYIGKFAIPAMANSTVNTSPNRAMTQLQITIECQTRHKGIAQRLLETTRQRVVENSIYQSKALSITTGTDPETGETVLNPPKFLALPKDEPIVFLNRETQAKVATLETLITKTDQCQALGIATKHGSLFHGVYGTGKTLTSQRLAWNAIRHGWTYIYCRDTKALPFVMPFVALYDRVVLFAEDIERTAEDSELQNILDGVQSKTSKNFILILTTNHRDQVPMPLRRPGRFDSVIEFPVPDAEVSGKLAAMFAGGQCGFDTASAGEILQGLSPAMIRAIVDQSKVVAMGHTVDDTPLSITRSDLDIARSMYNDHIAYSTEIKTTPKTGYELIGESLGNAIAAAYLLRAGNAMEQYVNSNYNRYMDPEPNITAAESEAAEILSAKA